MVHRRLAGGVQTGSRASSRWRRVQYQIPEDFEDEEIDEDEAFNADDEELYGDRLPAKEVSPAPECLPFWLSQGAHRPRRACNPIERAWISLTHTLSPTNVECCAQTDEHDGDDEEFGDTDGHEDSVRRTMPLRSCSAALSQRM